MKNLVVGMFAVLGLAACSDDDGGGSGGAGGIQPGEGTTQQGSGGDAAGSTGDTGSSVSTGSGPSCEATVDGEAVCAAAVACDGNTLPEECASDLGEERCADAACTGLYDGWLSCVASVAESGEWDVCPDFPAQCDLERSLYEECLDPADCSAGPDAGTVCEAVADCEGQPYESCLVDLTAERCVYEDGSECRTLVDTYYGCLAGVAEAGDWSECPDIPEGCRDAFDDYAASCI